MFKAWAKPTACIYSILKCINLCNACVYIHVYKLVVSCPEVLGAEIRTLYIIVLIDGGQSSQPRVYAQHT